MSDPRPRKRRESLFDMPPPNYNNVSTAHFSIQYQQPPLQQMPTYHPPSYQHGHMQPTIQSQMQPFPIQQQTYTHVPQQSCAYFQQPISSYSQPLYHSPSMSALPCPSMLSGHTSDTHPITSFNIPKSDAKSGAIVVTTDDSLQAAIQKVRATVDSFESNQVKVVFYQRNLSIL